MGRGKKKSFKDLDFSESGISISEETKQSIIAVLLILIGSITFLSLVGAAGTAGVYINLIGKLCFGALRWFTPFGLVFLGYILLRPAKYTLTGGNYGGLIIFILSLTGLVHASMYADELFAAAKLGLGGGFVGLIFAWPLVGFFGFWASLLLLLALLLIGAFLLFNTSFNQISSLFGKAKGSMDSVSDAQLERRIQKAQEEQEALYQRGGATTESFSSRPLGAADRGESAGKHDEGDEDEALPVDASGGVRRFKQVSVTLPTDLLTGKTGTPKGGDLEANKAIIKKTLKNFSIEVEMGDAQVGPTVTQYTLKPAEGVRLSKISGLTDNLALALAAHPIRIEAPIPGRPLVGIEVPNAAKAIVPLRDVIVSEEFKKRESNTMIALGKDVMGRPQLVDLQKMPHLLIAGSTGSGKSVMVNSLILSLLYQNNPSDLKFIMVDPKRVELPAYNSIPHLLTPVITDVKKTINALRWAVSEMERRFEVLSQAHKRNLESYNQTMPEKIPFIVFIIDELADLMAASGPEVEAAIVRLAQMARAVGIHLVLATQRPSVDVITGLIKANITARIAFSVASLVDSRTILDMSGAEKLLGRGDMLYISSELGKPKRLQGAFTSDDEIKNITDYLKEQAEPEYIQEVTERQKSVLPGGGSAGGEDDQDGDELLEEAKQVVMQAKKASASLLQRRLRVGYARAARLLDLMEAQGFIGPADGAKPREVLLDALRHATMNNPTDDQMPEEGEEFLADEITADQEDEDGFDDEQEIKEERY